MPIRKPFQENTIDHIYNRGLNKSSLFFEESDYKKFMYNVNNYLDKKYKNLEMLAFCILPNHFHFVIKNLTEGFELSSFVGNLCTSYAKYYTQKYSKPRGISVFESRFKSKLIKDEKYLNQVIYYVNFNTLKHEIVKDIDDRYYTSYHQMIERKRKGETYNNKQLEELEKI